MALEIFDTHCHLTGLSDEELAAVIERARDASVTRLLCIGAGDGEAAAPRAVAIAERYANVWASVGIHPHDAAVRQDLSALEPLLSHPKVVAIGETGLDFFRDWAPVDLQYALFRSTISVAKNLRKPLIIHARAAERETIDVLREMNAHEAGGVFHCFSGDAALAAELADMNFIVSFTGAVTFKSADALRAVVRDIPLEGLMIETDAPYMAPEPFRGKPCEPMHVSYVARKLAEVKGLPLETIAKITTETALRLFQIPAGR